MKCAICNVNEVKVDKSGIIPDCYQCQAAIFDDLMRDTYEEMDIWDDDKGDWTYFPLKDEEDEDE